MHATDSRTAKEATERDANPGDAIADSDEGEEQHENRDKEGNDCKERRVGDLDLRLVIPQYNGSVADKVHRPDGDASHCHSSAGENYTD